MSNYPQMRMPAQLVETAELLKRVEKQSRKQIKAARQFQAKLKLIHKILTTDEVLELNDGN